MTTDNRAGDGAVAISGLDIGRFDSVCDGRKIRILMARKKKKEIPGL